MKSEYLIDYNIFCQRKNFSLENYLKNNDTITYEKLQQEFYNISVTPPKKFLYETLMEKIMLEKKPVEAPVNIVKEPTKKPKEEKPAPKRRRRRKTKND